VLDRKELKHAKLSEDSLKSFLGIWCRLKKELDHQVLSRQRTKSGRYGIRFPLPATARKIILPGSYWNLGKTGGDTLTRLFDEAEARGGVRTENNVATSRVFMYAAAAIHRLSQYFSARKDVVEYPTLRAYRDAANHRTSLKETLRRIATKVVQLSRKESSSSVEEVQLPSPTGVFELSQIPEVDGELMDEDEEVVLGAASPEARAMPYAAGKTGKSPNARGKSVDYVDNGIEE